MGRLWMHAESANLQARKVHIIGTTKVIFYYAEGHHTKLILQVPKPISPRLITFATCLNQNLDPVFHSSLRVWGLGSQERLSSHRADQGGFSPASLKTHRAEDFRSSSCVWLSCISDVVLWVLVIRCRLVCSGIPDEATFACLKVSFYFVHDSPCLSWFHF